MFLIVALCSTMIYNAISLCSCFLSSGYPECCSDDSLRTSLLGSRRFTVRVLANAINPSWIIASARVLHSAAN